MKETDIDFFSLDGTRLVGGAMLADSAVAQSVLFVHGAGVDRHEDGFYDRALDVMSAAGLGVLRFDLRGHGESDGQPEDLTVAGALSDIAAAWLQTSKLTRGEPAFALGSSFGGGLLALATLRTKLQRIALVNPLLKFRKRFLEDKPFWSNDGLSPSARKELVTRGHLPHVGPIVMSRPFINEVFWMDPFDNAVNLTAEVLVLHGTQDSRASFSVASEWASRVGAELVAFEGAEHGLCVSDDDDFSDPQTQAWQGDALNRAANWFLEY